MFSPVGILVGGDASSEANPFASAGRTLKEKQRKQYVEKRLEDIDKDACQLRLHLKRLG